MKKILVICLLAIMIPFTLLLSACNNNPLDTFNLTLNWVIVDENGRHVLHNVKGWDDSSSSDSCMFDTYCCGNYFWTTANRAIMYRDKPAEIFYDFECKGK